MSIFIIFVKKKLFPPNCSHKKKKASFNMVKLLSVIIDYLYNAIILLIKLSDIYIERKKIV